MNAHLKAGMPVEEVIISTNSAAPAETWDCTELELDAALQQRDDSGRQKYRFVLFNYRILSVCIEQVPGKARTYELYIHMLDPRPRRRLSVCWHYPAAFLVFSLASVLSATISTLPYPVAMPMILGACAGLAAARAISNSHVNLVFYSVNGRIPLVSFLYRRPNRRSFDTFIDILVNHIASAGNSQRKADRNEALNTELREHRRLMGAGIIREQDYDKAKSRILDKHH